MQRRVLVTGASGGIGQALCRAFVQNGDCVIGQFHKNGAAMAALKSQLGDALTTVSADLSSPSQIETLADFVLPQGVDVLINNAGQALFGVFQCVNAADADRLFQLNTQAALRLSQRLLPPMIARKRGCILNVSSMWGRVGASCEVHYSASKAALIGFTKALAKEVGPSGVRVNCLAPGFIDTPMNALLDDAARQAVIDETPLCRAGTPEDVAAAALFLASDSAGFITGQVLGVDGGLV
ncbi:MAG: SDR family oxidoreductase [Clostridia bacterium]|nr:SDR family oxidoreductase [Clostridia bacterium]